MFSSSCTITPFHAALNKLLLSWSFFTRHNSFSAYYRLQSQSASTSITAGEVPPPPQQHCCPYIVLFLTALECVTIFDVTEIKLIAVSTDGWNIETIVTTFADNKGRTYSGSIDRNVNRWVDHQDKPEYESYVLNLSRHG